MMKKYGNMWDIWDVQVMPVPRAPEQGLLHYMISFRNFKLKSRFVILHIEHCYVPFAITNLLQIHNYVIDARNLRMRFHSFITYGNSTPTPYPCILLMHGVRCCSYEAWQITNYQYVIKVITYRTPQIGDDIKYVWRPLSVRFCNLSIRAQWKTQWTTQWTTQFLSEDIRHRY